MSAAKLDLTIEAGATFRQTLLYQDPNGVAVPLTGYFARMQIRARADDPEILHTMTSPADGIAVGPLAGEIHLRIGADVTNTFLFKNAVYDLELAMTADPTEVVRLVEGKVTVNPNVTR